MLSHRSDQMLDEAAAIATTSCQTSIHSLKLSKYLKVGRRSTAIINKNFT